MPAVDWASRAVLGADMSATKFAAIAAVGLSLAACAGSPETGAGPKERLAEGYYNFGLSEKFRLSFHLTHVLEKKPGQETLGYLVPGIRLQASF